MKKKVLPPVGTSGLPEENIFKGFISQETLKQMQGETKPGIPQPKRAGWTLSGALSQGNRTGRPGIEDQIHALAVWLRTQEEEIQFITFCNAKKLLWQDPQGSLEYIKGTGLADLVAQGNPAAVRNLENLTNTVDFMQKIKRFVQIKRHTWAIYGRAYVMNNEEDLKKIYLAIAPAIRQQFYSKIYATVFQDDWDTLYNMLKIRNAHCIMTCMSAGTISRISRTENILEYEIKDPAAIASSAILMNPYHMFNHADLRLRRTGWDTKLLDVLVLTRSTFQFAQQCPLLAQQAKTSDKNLTTWFSTHHADVLAKEARQSFAQNVWVEFSRLVSRKITDVYGGTRGTGPIIELGVDETDIPSTYLYEGVTY